MGDEEEERMSKPRSTRASRRVVRRNRTFFEAMSLTGMSADDLRRAVDTYSTMGDALMAVWHAVAESVVRSARAVSDVLDAMGGGMD
jgi:hypothetical protein